MTRALEGIRVIDLTQVEFGPVCTQALGDFGADVIKVERPGVGDLSRTTLPEDPAGLDNPVFLSLNRNKRSLELDLRADYGKEVLRSLVRDSDVIVNNFRPGVMERLGFGYEQLREINPGLIYACGSGFGPSGPYVHKGGQDVLAQAMSGAMARKADPGHPLAIYATALADYSAGMLMTQGILLALLARHHSGEGQRVDVCLYDAMLSMQLQEATMWLMRQVNLNWAAKPLSGVFEAQDGAIVIVGAFKANPLREICRALDLADLSTEDRFSSESAQEAHRQELQLILRERIAQNTTEHWLERLEQVDILCGPVLPLSSALDDPQVRANGMIWTMSHPTAGEVRTVANPVKLSGTPAAPLLAPPRLGQHTNAILSELGYSSHQIERVATSQRSS